VIDRLIAGIRRFRTEIYPRHERLYRSLAHGQSPHTLMVTCSDSRLDPHLVTQSLPGELFVIRNAGNIVPPHGLVDGSEEATIEFALAKLDVSCVVVCGHSNCGAMAALVGQVDVSDLKEMRQWLKHAEPVQRELWHSGLEGDDLVRAAVQKNVLIQIEHLRSHPTVQERLAKGNLEIYGWVFDIESGDVLGYDSATERFESLSERADPELAQRIDLAHTPRGSQVPPETE
jgi:carbonic anhydrase